MRALVLLTLALAGCRAEPISTSDGERTDGRKVELVAVAPDGTHLWRFDDGRTVYFASTGTQRTSNCGKNCWRTEQVPTGSPESLPF